MSAYISVELQRQIRNRFTNCCVYCLTAELLTATTFEFEHIIPRSAIGETMFENLCSSCPSCNRYKADRQHIIDTVLQKKQRDKLSLYLCSDEANCKTLLTKNANKLHFSLSLRIAV